MEKGNLFTPTASDPAFEAFYRSKLEPLSGTAEAHRRFVRAESNRRLRAALIAIVSAALLTGISAFPGLRGLWFFFLVAQGIAAVGLGAWVYWPVLGRAEKQKSEVASRVVPFYGDLEFDAQPNLDLNRYEKWHFLPKFDARWAKDQVRGSHLGVPLAMTEVTLLKHARRKGSSSSSTSEPFFEGLFCDLRLAEKCQGTAVFGTSEMFKGGFAVDESQLTPRGRWSFDFEVYSSDEEETARLMTSDFLLALDQIRDELGAKRLTGSFRKDRLLMLIEREAADLERPLDVEVDLRRHSEIVRGHLASLLGIVETLALDPALEPDETVIRIDEKSREEAATEQVFQAPSSYEGWGCLMLFATVTLLFSAASWLARGRVPDPWLVVTAAGASAAVTAIGLAIYRMIRRRG